MENERAGGDHRSVVQRRSTLQGITAETKIQRLGHELLYQATSSRQKVIGLNAEQECCITTHILVGDMQRNVVSVPGQEWDGSIAALLREGGGSMTISSGMLRGESVSYSILDT